MSRMRTMLSISSLVFGRVYTGSRLVERQQARIGRQRTNDLESSLLRAVRKRASLVVRQVLHVENAGSSSARSFAMRSLRQYCGRRDIAVARNC